MSGNVEFVVLGSRLPGTKVVVEDSVVGIAVVGQTRLFVKLK